MSGKLLLGGFAVVLVATAVMLHSLGEADEVPVTAAVPPAPADEPAAEPPAPAPATTPPPRRTPRRAPAAEPAPAAAPIPALRPAVTDDPDIERFPDGRTIPVATLTQLRYATFAVDDLVRECIAQSGVRNLSGTAMLTFTAARVQQRDGSYTVETESSGVDEDGTTIDHPELLECMHKTALEMKFPPSKSPIAVWAKRRVIIENNVLKENLVIQWGRL